MKKKLKSNPRLTRMIEVILGMLLVVVLISSYTSGPQDQDKYLLQYIIPNRILFNLVTIVLYLVAARLLSGPPEDYSRIFYNIFTKWSKNRN